MSIIEAVTPATGTDCPEDILLQIARLARQYPSYEFWTEHRQSRPCRFIARRDPGGTTHPFAIVTADLDELRAALAQSQQVA